jgi:hypothetical protein
MARQLDKRWTDRFMRRDTPEMRSNRQELFGIGGGTSRSDPVYPPTGKRVRVGYSGRDPIHVDDAVRPYLPTIFARRSEGPMIKKVITHDLPDGGYRDDELGPLDRAHHRDYPENTIHTRRLNGLKPEITPVITHNLPDDGYYNHELGPLVHAYHNKYPPPNNYTVRTIHSADVRTHGCRCAHGCRWDPVTGQAEFFCRCGNRDCDPADYAGEWEDDRPLFMRDDLKTKGLFGGNPYKC